MDSVAGRDRKTVSEFGHHFGKRCVASHHTQVGLSKTDTFNIVEILWGQRALQLATVSKTEGFLYWMCDFLMISVCVR